MKRIALLLFTTALAACQSHNPYTTDSVPIPPAPPGAANHFDRSAYPACLLYTSPSPRDVEESRMPSSA